MVIVFECNNIQAKAKIPAVKVDSSASGPTMDISKIHEWKKMLQRSAKRAARMTAMPTSTAVR